MPRIFMLVDLGLQLVAEVLRLQRYLALQHADCLILLLHFYGQLCHLGLEFLTLKEVPEMRTMFNVLLLFYVYRMARPKWQSLAELMTEGATNFWSGVHVPKDVVLVELQHDGPQPG